MTGRTADRYGDALHEVSAWWLARISECVPKGLRKKPAEHVVVPVGEDGQLSAAVSEGIRTCVLRLPPGCIPVRTVMIPVAAARDAAQVVRSSFGRLTPFREADVRWTLRFLPKTGDGSAVPVELRFVPRFLCDPAIAQLAEQGVTVTAVTAQDGTDGQMVEIPLSSVRSRRRISSRVWGALLVGVLLVPPGIQAGKILLLDHRLRMLAPQVEQAGLLRLQIASGTAGADAVERENRRTGSAGTTLVALTDALPDDTFLTALRLHERHLTLEGQTQEAAHLIGLLQHRAGFSDVTFSGPLTHADHGNSDFFTLSAETPR